VEKTEIGEINTKHDSNSFYFWRQILTWSHWKFNWSMQANLNLKIWSIIVIIMLIWH